MLFIWNNALDVDATVLAGTDGLAPGLAASH